MKLKAIILSFVTATFGVIAFVPVSRTYAFEVLSDPCQKAPDSVVCQESKKEQSPTNNSIFGPNGIFTKAAGIVTILVGIASVIMIIVGGFRYVMSAGDSNNITGAKNTILYAIIGLIVAVVAQGIIVFVIKRI